MRYRASLAVLAVAVLLTAACAPGRDLRSVPEPGPPLPTPAPRPLSLPADDAGHDEPIEWWYYSGFLESETGRGVGFHTVIFQTRSPQGGTSYLAQFSLTDVDGQRHVQSAGHAGAEGAGADGLLALSVGSFTLEIEPDRHVLHAFDDEQGAGLSLELMPGKVAMLHGSGGWLGSDLGWTYYYSRPRMPVSGQITLDGEAISVTGAGWYDHQWGDFFVVGYPAGWDWFAINLDDGASLMLSKARGTDGGVEAVYGTYVPPEGESRHLDESVDGITIEPTGTWSSPVTGGVYPSGWSIAVDSLDLRLTIAPEVPDQEMTAGLQPAAVYWEGVSSVTGASSSGPVAGRAYVELTGYVVPPPIEWRAP